jgi:hypothetical protein
MPYNRHVTVMRNAYTDYQLNAYAAGATPEQVVKMVEPTQRRGSLMPLTSHTAMLQHARTIYADSLAQILASTGDKVGACDGVRAPVLVRQPSAQRSHDDVTLKRKRLKTCSQSIR